MDELNSRDPIVTFWWVNQNQSWRHEIYGEYLWAPKLDALGRHSHFCDNMTRLRSGDIVLSHFSGALRYAGVVLGTPLSSRKPVLGFADGSSSDEGWTVDMRFTELAKPIRPQDHLDLYIQVAPEHYGPMNSEGRVNQQYLFELPTVLGSHYLDVAGLDEEMVRDAARYDPSVESLLHEAEEVLIDPVLTTTERHVLARARVGQGVFKEQVRKIEPKCRLTGLSGRNYLVASHMKPWRVSNNLERLDGHNGLLLSPHVAFLFDRGLITFEDNGRIVTSTLLTSIVPQLWTLDFVRKGKRFSREQIPYLEFHRDQVFRGGWTLPLGREPDF